jgi:hypothetical protein
MFEPEFQSIHEQEPQLQSEFQSVWQSKLHSEW